jgi:dTDP-4-amino-4,6-dideoxygalactose transaminase
MAICPFRLSLGEEEEAAVLGVLRSGQIAVGPEIEEFERDLASEVEVSAAAAVSSGFAALHLALLTLGVRQGDEVIMPCVSTCAAIRDATWAAGAVPIFADTNGDDFNLDPKSVGEKLAARTRAIIAPHHIGIVSRMDELNAFEVPVIEDCAQAIGATFRGKPVGSLSTLSVFSFYATKLLTTIDGGAVASDRTQLIDTVRDLRYYGARWDSTPRFNYKMQNLGASLGRVQLRGLRSSIARRQRIGAIYSQALTNGGAPAEASLHRDPESIVYRFGFRMASARREAVRMALEREGIPCRTEVGFLAPNPADFPAAERLAAEVLTLPTYPALTDDEIDFIATTLTRILRAEADWTTS